MDSRKEKGRLRRLTGAIKEYYGTFPLLTGLLASGAVNLIAFSIGALYNSSDSVTQFVASGNYDLVEALYKLPETAAHIYSESRGFASIWTMPAFTVGQFAGYKLKTTVKSWFNKK